MERREVRWERMFPDELEAAFEDCPVVYLPYGLCEPHGPVNALGLGAASTRGGVPGSPVLRRHCSTSRILALPRIGRLRDLGTRTGG